MGGEKEKLRDAYALLMGSPPRGRGKGVQKMANVPEAGITPAQAGKRLQKNPGGGL